MNKQVALGVAATAIVVSLAAVWYQSSLNEAAKSFKSDTHDPETLALIGQSIVGQNQDKTRLIDQLADEIGTDNKLQRFKPAKIVLIAKFENGIETINGFASEKLHRTPIGSISQKIMNTVAELRAAMPAASTNQLWEASRISFDFDFHNIDIAFEYVNPHKWDDQLAR